MAEPLWKTPNGHASRFSNPPERQAAQWPERRGREQGSESPLKPSVDCQGSRFDHISTPRMGPFARGC